ncbi:MAG TPA: hypothetical protein VL326_23485 [Kofleriaceae bacterium]|nr:hypothetical protein [Kofleriaceae bacterium]
MMMLPALAVIFAGLTGGHHARIEKQVQKVVRALHVDVKPLPAAVIQKLTHHDASTRDTVRKLHVDAVIAGEVTAKGDLRIVIYDRDGKLASFTESSLTNEELTDDDIAVLRDNLASDLEPFLGAPDPEPAPAPPPRTPMPAPAPAPTTPKPSASPPTIDMEGVDNDNPLGETAAPAEAPADAAAADAAAPTDAVSADEIEAMMGSAEATADESAPSPLGPELHLGARAGFGIAQRTFAPGMSSIAGYGSSPVGAVHVAVDVQPMKHVGLHLATERTLGMTTPLDSGDASTVVSRWEATGGYAIPVGRIELAPSVGLGRRAFSIHSEDPNRSPDSSYNYLVLGARGRMPVGKHLGIEAFAAFEPVVSGTEATEMALGEATRWAIDGGAALDVRFGHALVRAAADYQRFTWTWNMAGARGAGGATDAYLTGSLSIGAEY